MAEDTDAHVSAAGEASAPSIDELRRAAAETRERLTASLGLLDVKVRAIPAAARQRVAAIAQPAHAGDPPVNVAVASAVTAARAIRWLRRRSAARRAAKEGVVPFTNVIPFRTAVIDVDGTLVDSNDAHAEAWVQAFRENGVPTDTSIVRPLIGMGGDRLIPVVAMVKEDSPLGQAVSARKKALFDERVPALQPTPGARRLVEFLRDHRVEPVVATSADEREMKALLAVAGLDDLFRLHTSKDDASRSKPAPDIVHAALARAGASAATAVMIGDTPYDIEAAARAGLKTIALRCGGYWSDADLHQADWIFDDPAALLAHLKCGP